MKKLFKGLGIFLAILFFGALGFGLAAELGTKEPPKDSSSVETPADSSTETPGGDSHEQPGGDGNEGGGDSSTETPGGDGNEGGGDSSTETPGGDGNTDDAVDELPSLYEFYPTSFYFVIAEGESMTFNLSRTVVSSSLNELYPDTSYAYVEYADKLHKFDVRDGVSIEVLGAEGTQAVTVYGIEYLENNQFEDNQYLTSVSFGSSFVHIGEKAFYNCKNLTTFSLQESRGELEIGRYAFAGSGLSSFDWAYYDMGISVGEYAFANCEKLTEIPFDTSLLKVAHCFEGCTSLTDIYVPDNLFGYNGTLGEDVFKGVTSVNVYVGGEEAYESFKANESFNAAFEEGVTYYVKDITGSYVAKE